MTVTPTLTAPGIVLRPLIPTDAAALFIALSDPDVQLYRRAPAHTALFETQAYIADTLAKSRAAWAITIEGSEALGRLALRVPQPDTGEFGIVIRAAAQGRGLGLKAIQLAEDFAFGDVGVRVLRANIDIENAASRGLFARAGFQIAAHLTADRTTDLGVRDSVLMEKLR
ncbi:MAG: GNAT family N-acetyltransferase [Hyphomonadaceae bacterium]|nr:GNAT family N-acetyltransferase [Hyphomonadaceae bacterium]